MKKGYRTPDAEPSKRRSFYVRGSVSAGNSSRYGECTVYPIVGPRNKSPRTVGHQLRKTSHEWSMGNDCARSSEGDAE